MKTTTAVRQDQRTKLRADYPLARRISILFIDNLPEGLGLWAPERQAIMLDGALRGRELAVTLLHEIGHLLCADHGDVLTDEEHDLLEEWAVQSAWLLDIVRPGRRAVPA